MHEEKFASILASKSLVEVLNDAALLKEIGVETVTRDKVLPETGVEYGDHSVSMAEGCFHGCKYCFDASRIGRFDRSKTYEDCCKPKLVKDFLPKLDEEIAAKKGNIKSALLSFSCDPFPYGATPAHQLFHAVSYEALRKINAAGITGVVLTKGVLDIKLADMAPAGDEGKKNYIGISLVSLDDSEGGYKDTYEPFSAKMHDRLASLKAIAATGKCKTWVSLEPMPTPSFFPGATEDSMIADLKALLDELKFVDLVVMGRGNGINIENESLFTKYKGHRDYYIRLAEVVKAWGEANHVQVYIKRKVYAKPARRTKKAAETTTAEVVGKAADGTIGNATKAKGGAKPTATTKAADKGAKPKKAKQPKVHLFE